MSTTPSAPTLEYTCSTCTCGKELSTIHYLITAKAAFETLARDQRLSERSKNNLGFTTLETITAEYKLNFCCLMNLRYGIRVPVSTIDNSSEREKVGSHKYPEGLPGPLSHEKTLTWL